MGSFVNKKGRLKAWLKAGCSHDWLNATYFAAKTENRLLCSPADHKKRWSAPRERGLCHSA